MQNLFVDFDDLPTDTTSRATPSRPELPSPSLETKPKRRREKLKLVKSAPTLEPTEVVVQQLVKDVVVLSSQNPPALDWILEISNMLKEVHQQLQHEQPNPASEARIEALQTSLVATETTVEEMEVAYVDKAKTLVSAKAYQEATDQIISQLHLQLGTETSKQQKLEEESKRQEACSASGRSKGASHPPLKGNRKHQS